ncbi:MAG: tRNA preQ1(34) S-adenosylmethionine ribosyltransferase-isomerase QueA [Deltaproteobacteria bacterium]|nr:tRNA preQ1(34) S-adenosylmethionine ribosyltransferase-isomerase QueA [Deltaproteobacteria bacterium]
MFNIEDYDFELKEELIAQTPTPDRDRSRLLRVNRISGTISDSSFHELPGLLEPGDLLVINNTRVVPARLYGQKESGGRIEILVLEHPETLDNRISQSRWCLLKSSKRPARGSRVYFEKGLIGTIEGLDEGGLARILFSGPVSLDHILENEGIVPLPPYIKRDGRELSSIDRERYQTIFSSKRGAVAAPTAGLHFTPEVVAGLKARGIGISEITLHVGYGTFQPVRVKDIREHLLSEEYYSIPPETAKAINMAKQEKRRVIAVGTTTVRTLESAALHTGGIEPSSGKTGLLITPGFSFRVIDGLVTNFHLPRSSLLFLVSAFGRRELIKKAYAHAISGAYRFYSYGDAMLIL